ncbi:MAG: anthranilate synthase component I [Lentisphaerae bacterium]|nr:anthranilate synthase component I [Lentisphaerota bacterium]
MILETFPSRKEFCEAAKNATVIPVATRILADTETPVSVVARFSDRPDPLFLLESAEGGERWGRYSFVGVSARAHVSVYRDEVVVREGYDETRIAHHNEPLKVLRNLMTGYTLADLPGLPRFCGGLVGYLAYEMAHFFEPRIPNRLPAEKPLAQFVVPDALLVSDSVTHTLTIIALAFTADNPDAIELLYDNARAHVDELLATIERPLPPPHHPQPHHKKPAVPLPTKPPQVYRDNVNLIKDHIVAGDIIQCVISQSFACAAPDDIIGLYRAQRFVNPSPYLYLLKFGDIALVGSSPETMIRLEHRTATLRPIAGTRPRGTTEQQDRTLADDLLQDEKERAEHIMLVDLGRHELGRVAIPGTVQVTDLMVVERYSHVMHLVSNITADLDSSYDAFDLLPATFPAGTLSGAPKVRAMELIAEVETEPRGPYGGAVGYIAFGGNMDFAICIRTAVIEHGRLTVRAGAGLVADSDPECELQETINKARSVARALELMCK